MAFAFASHVCRAHVQRNLGNNMKNWALSASVLKRTSLPPTSVLQIKQQSLYTDKRNLAEAGHAAHNHTPIWTAERVVSASLLAVLPAAFAFPNTALDYVAAVALTAHVHWGVEAIAVDYARPAVVGQTLAKAAVVSVYLLSILTLGGLFYFNYHDVGLMQAIRMLWKL